MDEKKELKGNQEVDEDTNKTDTYIPEQLDDDEFEKEKSKLKAEKEAKKAEKAKKKAKEILLDEEGNPIKRKRKKSEKITIVVVIVLILAVIIGIVGYLVYSLNRPENVIIDFLSYVNEEDWDSAINLVDMQGYLTMELIDMEAEEDENVSYVDFENKYETIFDELKELEYGELLNSLEYGKENNSDIMSSLFTQTTLTIENVDNVEKIGDTNLYKVSVTMKASDDTGTYSDETSSYDMYVAKIDGEFKIVGGAFPSMIFYYYGYYYAYSTMGN